MVLAVELQLATQGRTCASQDTDTADHRHIDQSAHKIEVRLRLAVAGAHIPVARRPAEED